MPWHGARQTHQKFCVSTKQNLHMVVTKEMAVAAPERCVPRLPHNHEQRQEQLWPIPGISLVCVAYPRHLTGVCGLYQVSHWGVCACVCIFFHPLKVFLRYITSSLDNHRKDDTARASVLPLKTSSQIQGSTALPSK